VILGSIATPPGASSGAIAVFLITLWCGSACSPPEAGLPRGEALFDTCEPCHGAEGAGTPELAAPAIAGLPQWYIERQLEKFRDGVRGAHPDDLPGMRMRPMAVTLNKEDDIASVAEYVATLPRVMAPGTLHGNAGVGASTFTTICFVCHGNDAEGNELLGAPPLVAASDWYLLGQLRNFRSGARGADPRDTWGLTMRANAIALSDQNMQDVITYIRTLR
jgi:cytochrome c553